MATDYGNVFQDRYMKALSAFTDAASQGRDPREILAEMQTQAPAGDPTYGQATGRGNLPVKRPSGRPMTEVEFQSDLPSSRNTRTGGPGSMTDVEFQEFQSDAAPRARPVGSGSMTDVEAEHYNRSFMENYPSTPLTTDMEFRAYQKALIDGGGINALGSTPEQLLLNLGRKLRGGP
jgi:hypothetical protein